MIFGMTQFQREIRFCMHVHIKLTEPLTINRIHINHYCLKRVIIVICKIHKVH